MKKARHFNRAAPRRPFHDSCYALLTPNHLACAGACPGTAAARATAADHQRAGQPAEQKFFTLARVVGLPRGGEQAGPLAAADQRFDLGRPDGPAQAIAERFVAIHGRELG